MPADDLFKFDKKQECLIIGTDEAGRGPAAGGVFASAVYFPEINKKLIEELTILNDSKKITGKKRESIYELIKNETLYTTLFIELE